jgi:hypothetical protein
MCHTFLEKTFSKHNRPVALYSTTMRTSCKVIVASFMLLSCARANQGHFAKEILERLDEVRPPNNQTKNINDDGMAPPSPPEDGVVVEATDPNVTMKTPTEDATIEDDVRIPENSTQDENDPEETPPLSPEEGNATKTDPNATLKVPGDGEDTNDVSSGIESALGVLPLLAGAIVVFLW